jgi:hypothetical protein
MAQPNPTSRWRRNRSTPIKINEATQPAPTPSVPPPDKPLPKLERSASRMSLFSLFSKPKVERARGHIEVGLAVPLVPQQIPKAAPVSIPQSAARSNNSPPAVQQVHPSRSNSAPRPTSMKPTGAKKLPDDWSPPPLFQAYPQSIKHATIQTSGSSPDVLLRTQSQRKQHDLLRERMDSHRDLTTTLENSAEIKKLEKNHKRLLSTSMLTLSTEMTSKIFVLVTSGYVLQYSVDGPFDRLPEKALQLGKESAAFACDLIPGKHWVLQISQSALEDGTVTLGPKNSLLGRFTRLQGTSVRRTATSLLLVLESAEEMDQWMSAVRKEIDNLGGMKAREEPIRESMEASSEKQSLDSGNPSHRFLVQRDPKRVSKIAPVDSPLQSQYSGSPKIVASDWEGSRSEKTVSITDSSSVHSSRYNAARKSVEVSSVVTTPVTQVQYSLDQPQARSRHSYISITTSASGSGTRDTSRNSSPAPASPLEEYTLADKEPPRNAKALRPFQMSSGNPAGRRSMHILPVTNEDSSLSASASVTPQRHSIYGPASPSTGYSGQDLVIPKLSVPAPMPAPALAPASDLVSQASLATRPVRYSITPQPRYGVRSSSAPPVRFSTVLDPAQASGRPQSTASTLLRGGTVTPRPRNRTSQSPKPFMKPFPVRPQAQHMEERLAAPRRISSLGPAPAPIPLGIVGNRSVTMPVRPPSVQSNSSINLDSMKPLPQSQTLRRPASVQIRSDPAPFLSSSRPAHGPARASTPSFVPNKRQSATPTISVYPSPSIPVLRQQAEQEAVFQLELAYQRSMPAMGLPPPAPPPTMPLPRPPPSMPLPRPPIAPPRAIAV